MSWPGFPSFDTPLEPPVSGITLDVLEAVYYERERQEQLKAQGRFRYTCADLELPSPVKLAVLIEEVGEVGKQVLTDPDRPFALDTIGSSLELQRELLHVAAVCVAWLESLHPDRLV